MTLEVYTYTNGDVAHSIFNAIATFFTTDSFASMLQICAIFAVFATASHFFMTRDVNAIPKWAAIYLCVPLFLVNTKTDIQIIDLTAPSSNYPVANVPAVVAIPTHLSSVYMYGVTKSVEDIFHALDDEQYGKTGMMFGSKIYQLSRQSFLDDSKLKGEWLHYMQSCIRGDINLNHKYTWEELANAPDIFAFLASKNPSPLRRIQMGPTDFPTCQEALPKLKDKFDKNTDDAIKLMATKAYGSKATVNVANLKAGLQGSYAKYAKISRSASQITTQNMVINAIRNGLSDGAALNNNTAAAINYAYTQNKMQTTSMWAGMFLQAREFLPMMQSILFLLFGCISFLVVCLAMLPSMTFMVLTNYAKGFIYLGTWPILFALINFIMTTRLSLSTAAVADIYKGITLSNVDPIAEMHSRYAAMTGFLMMSVPMICGFIVKGGASVMGSMSHQFAGMMNSVNSRTSASAASGDINLGNGQVDNFSFNNTNGNKMDTSALMRTHGVTMQNENGGSTTTLPGGKVFDGSQAISRGLGFDLNSREGITRSLRDTARDTHSQAETHRTAYNESTDKTFDQIAQFGQNTNKTLSYSDITSNKEGASTARAVNTMNSTVDEYAKLHSISHEEAESELTSGWISASVQGKKGFGIPFVAEASINGEVGGKKNWDDRTSDTTTESASDRQSRALQEQFNQSANIVKNYDLTDSASDTRTKADTALATIGDNLRETESLALTASTEFNHARLLDRQADKVEEMSNGVSFNLMQDFQAYMKDENPDHYEGIMYGSTEDLREQRAGYVQQFLNEPKTLAKLERYTDDKLPQTPQELRQEYETQTTELELTPAQRAAQQEKSHELQQRHDEGAEALTTGLKVRDYFDENEFYRIDMDTKEALANVGDDVNNKGSIVAEASEEKPPLEMSTKPKSSMESNKQPLDLAYSVRGYPIKDTPKQ